MDIGTAKLTPDKRGGIPHHLLDIWDVTVTADVAEYQWLARARIDALLAKGRRPILVGGSGLSVRGAVDGCSEVSGGVGLRRGEGRGRRVPFPGASARLIDQCREVKGPGPVSRGA